MQKKLEQEGLVEIVTVRNDGDIRVAYPKLLDVERKSWKHEHGTAISSIAKQEKMYSLIFDIAHKRGLLHLTLLSLNSEPIAYDAGLIKNDTYYYLKTSFDEKYRQLSPATVLRSKLIEDLIGRNVKYFDFPGEPYEWERQWTDELRWHQSLMVYNKTMRAKLFSLYRRMPKREEGRVEEGGFRYHNPKDIHA
jgi:CelD/BcsL family acetyltransferase involved in cellulose biosynthesis